MHSPNPEPYYLYGKRPPSTYVLLYALMTNSILNQDCRNIVKNHYQVVLDLLKSKTHSELLYGSLELFSLSKLQSSARIKSLLYIQLNYDSPTRIIDLLSPDMSSIVNLLGSIIFYVTRYCFDNRRIWFGWLPYRSGTASRIMLGACHLIGGSHGRQQRLVIYRSQ